MKNVYYFEIHVDDPERAMSFYGNVFGWKFEKSIGDEVEYWSISGSGVPGGIMKRPIPLADGLAGVNAFINSVQVDDFDEAEELILNSGGKITHGKFLIPDKCWQGYFSDTEGNTFGIFEVV